MHTRTVVGTVTLLLALCATACLAQDGYRQGNIPRGDYQQTCRNIYTEGNRLQAECQRRDGSWRASTLDNIDRCRGSIINNDGQLICGSSGNPQSDARREWRNGLPFGDYIETCRNAQVNGYRLDAECEKRNGKWRRTSLDGIDQCSAPIANNNGRLVCPKGGNGAGYYYNDQNSGDRNTGDRNYGDRNYGDRNGGQGGIPSGTYTQTCRNMRVEGDRLYAECQARDYSWHQTWLENVSRCTSGPANDNGQLVCPGGGSGYGNDSGNGNGYRFGWQNGLPSGTYMQSCRNIRAKGFALAADCQTSGGSWRNTSLFNFDQCTSAIANDDGHLTCAK